MADVLNDFAPSFAAFTAATPSIEVWNAARVASGLSFEPLTKKVAAHFKLAVADLNGADLRILKLIPEKLARRYTVFPIQQDDRRLYVATSEPGNLEAEQAIAFASSRTTVFQVAAPQDIQQAIARQYSPHTYVPPIDDRLFFQTVEPLGLQAAQPIAMPAIRMPVSPAMAPHAPREAVNVLRGTEKRGVDAVKMDQPHILIVDDDSLTRRLAWSILAKQGYRVVEAADGIEALKRVYEGTTLSLMMIDLNMPRLGGREVLRKLKSSATTAGIPVIVLTSSAEDSDEAELLAEGADDYMRKPLEPARFTARVKGVLQRTSTDGLVLTCTNGG
jgi:CheY-like chemotaxis protein